MNKKAKMNEMKIVAEMNDPLLLGRSQLGALCLIFTGEPWVKLPDLRGQL